MDFEYKQFRARLDPGNGRTFDPNSPKYNHGRPVLIDDVKRVPAQTSYMPPLTPIPSSQPVQRTNRQDPFEDIDFEALLKTPHREVNQTHHKVKTEKKTSFIGLAILIMLLDLGILAFSLSNQARYHHIYIGLMFVNVVLATTVFFKVKTAKFIYSTYQFILIAVSIGLAIYFTLNFLNTNRIYNKNYSEIKNNFFSMTYQQKQNLASYQDNIIANRNGYISQSKVFYPLMASQIIVGVTASIIVIKRR